MSYSKVKHKGKDAKLEVFGRNHKLAKSLPVHIHALEAGLCVPKIYEVREKDGKTYKHTEWIEGNTIQFEMIRNEGLIQPICEDLGRYVNELYDVNGIAAVDSHFENFVWAKRGVIYIDMKKILYRETKEEHILQMSKICLKSCKGDRRKTLAFLRGYAERRDVSPVIDDCNKRCWCWQPIRGATIRTGRISVEEVMDE
jgi:tRNA A-37 threonylcarbamoyl transferase component Bud32